MIGGVALLGVVTGSFATWLVDKVKASEEMTQAATRRDIADLSSKIDALNRRLDQHDLP